MAQREIHFFSYSLTKDVEKPKMTKKIFNSLIIQILGSNLGRLCKDNSKGTHNLLFNFGHVYDSRMEELQPLTKLI